MVTILWSVEPCLRIMRGDLKDDYEREVLDAPDGEEREKMMSVMNIMCGNIEIDCAYAAFDHYDSIRDGRNIFEQLGKLYYSLGFLMDSDLKWTVIKVDSRAKVEGRSKTG